MGSTPESSRKRTRMVTDSEEMEPDENVAPDEKAGLSGPYMTTEFQPPFYVVPWTSKHSNTRRLTVFVWLSSGCGKSSIHARHAVRIINDGSTLEYSLLWPKNLQSPREICDRFTASGLPLEDGEIIGLQTAISNARVSTIHGCQSMACIDLKPHRVVPNLVQMKSVGWSDVCGSYITAVRLHIHEEAKEIIFGEDDFAIDPKDNTGSIGNPASQQEANLPSKF